MDAIPPSTPTTAPPCLEGLINNLLAPLIPSTNAVQPFVPNVAQVQIAQRQEQNALLRLLAEQEGERLQQQAIVLAGRHHLSNSTVVENNRYQPTIQSPLSEFLIARLGASRY
jgi:hypothetical protein